MLCLTYYSPNRGTRQVIQRMNLFEASLRRSENFSQDEGWVWEEQNDTQQFCDQVIESFYRSDRVHTGTRSFDSLQLLS